MRKKWLMVLLAISMSTCMPLQAATNKVQVTYNGQKIETKQQIVVRHGKVWVPIDAIATYVKEHVKYYEEEKEVCLGNWCHGVVKANSPEDDGYHAILLNNTVYISTEQIKDELGRAVSWNNSTKTLSISSVVDIYDIGNASIGQFKYDLDNGDFYNGKIKVANLPFENADQIVVEKSKTDRMNVIYKVTNSFGEPHINYELYSVYVAGGNTYIVKSNLWGWDLTVNNAQISGNSVILLDQDEIKVYDDITGKLKKTHKINAQPLIDYAHSAWEPEEVDEYIAQEKSGYMLVAASDQFALYRHEGVRALTYVDLKTDQEVILYKVFYSPAEIATLEADQSRMRENDGLQFVKVENGMIYLEHSATGKVYTYKIG